MNITIYRSYLKPSLFRLHFDRDMAHREELATHVRKTLFFVTRFGAPAASLAFAKRPLSVWGIMVWKSDPSMTVALEQSLEFLAMVDFMTEMWQSERK
ncbi:3166_t:CDS:2 [Acaulospora colombiana]|uniref:3166_t:CDS:1 n=1 Tax=Acaulospora colombiana TaxID=27376 RepID=A0ACA9NG30_9GLOM|nr:3166_t:CDS:2 [Acaulospora colombiana]